MTPVIVKREERELVVLSFLSNEAWPAKTSSHSETETSNHLTTASIIPVPTFPRLISWRIVPLPGCRKRMRHATTVIIGHGSFRLRDTSATPISSSGTTIVPRED